MRLLLDTHTFVWYADDSPRLSKTARDAIRHPGNQIFVSLASAWEIAIKVRLGKLALPMPFDQLFPGTVQARGFILLGIELSHLRELLTLPLHHGDPFDRLLIAQVRTERMAFVSRDASNQFYGIPVIW